MEEPAPRVFDDPGCAEIGVSVPTYDSEMFGRFVLRLAMCTGTAGILLGIVAASDHSVAVLPADASAAGVLPAAVLLALLLSAVAEGTRRRS